TSSREAGVVISPLWMLRNFDDRAIHCGRQMHWPAVIPSVDRASLQEGCCTKRRQTACCILNIERRPSAYQISGLLILNSPDNYKIYIGPTLRQFQGHLSKFFK